MRWRYGPPINHSFHGDIRNFNECFGPVLEPAFVFWLRAFEATGDVASQKLPAAADMALQKFPKAVPRQISRTISEAGMTWHQG
ncbi:hypothetical protein QU42_28580 [Bradyrhizobium sp. UASWS1016]|jgi:hypothetical protein|nr:hypothetical protein QU42_28580 [Bradyrhizobium sp. UASWS1016]